MTDVELSPEAQAEVDAFKERLHKKSRRVEAARNSLIERAREAVAGYYSHGDGANPLTYMKALRLAIEEYDRMQEETA